MNEETIFATALEKPPTEREAYLAAACGNDEALRKRLEGLLAASEKVGNFMANPAVTSAVDPAATEALPTSADRGAKATNPDEEPLTFLSPPQRPDSLGRIGHYEVLQILGKGGFGIVFRAFDDMLQRVVAIKVMAPQLAATSPARRRFLREAQSSAAVRHENVVQVYEVVDQPLPYLAMEFIPGETLQQRLDRTGPLDVPEVLRIGRQIAEGLAAAHACDLIHRDIKPGNVLLEGGSHKAKITDFGLARAADDASISQSGIIAGTPMFMAPEQALGHKIDQRADLFSLGSVLYQMASGRPPFRAPSALAVLKRVAEEPPRPIPEIIPETPDWLCGIITKLHAKNPDDRFQSAREVADLLADCEAKLKAKQTVKNVLPAAVKPTGRKWVAAAAVLLLPVIALAVTEFGGVTRLFRGQQGTTDPIKPGPGPTPPHADGWVQLFNGTDLTGWKSHPDQPGDWRVEDRVLVGRGPRNSHLFSDRGDYGDFHLRVEAKLDPGGNSGVCFRSGLEFISVGADPGLRLPPGFEADINDAPKQSAKTGTLWRIGPGVGTPVLVKEALVPPDTWFQLEVIAVGPRVTIKVDGRTTADWMDDRTDYRTGHVALQVNWPATTIVRFRKIEIRELPAIPVARQEQPVADAWIPLFNGMDLTGWRTKENDKWKVENGVLIGSAPGHLFANQTYQDFHCRIKARYNADTSGSLAFRGVAEKNGEALAHGEVVIGNQLPGKTGSAHLWYKPKPEGVAIWDRELVPPDTWFELELIVRGKNVVVKVNGTTTADITLDRLPERGRISLNAYGSGTVLKFEKIEIKELPAISLPPTFGPFTDADVQSIAALPAAEQVEEVRKELMRRNPGFDGTVVHKIEGGGVTEIKVVTDKVTDISPIRVFNALRVLDCGGTWTNKANGLLADLTPLEGMNLAVLTHLNLACTKVTDAGMVYFKDCKGLVFLRLDGTKVSDGLAHFKDCKGLTFLRLGTTKVTDRDLMHFKDCKDVTYLDLFWTKVSDVGLANFKDCKNLTRLLLGNTQVTDAGLAHVKGLPLRMLWIENAGITDLNPLHGMPLEDIRLTPKNITRGLDILRGLKSVKTIGIKGNQASWPAAEFWERYDKGEFKE